MSSTLITFSKLTPGNKAGALNVFGAILPFPRTVEVNTEYMWEPEALGLVGSAIANSPHFDSGNLKSLMGSADAALKKVMANPKQAAAVAAASALGDSKVGLGTQKAAGIAINPKEEVLFKGVKHRAFSLLFDLAPLTAGDSVATMAFLSTLHAHAAPDLDGSGAFFKYPDTLSVTISGQGGVVLDRGNCAIKSIDVNMTPEQIWSSFTNGKPVHILLTIGFIELDLPTKAKDSKLFG